jgi:hypothetical protein
MQEIKYGTTLEDVKRVTAVGLIMGTVVALIAFISIYASGDFAQDRIWILGLLIILPSIPMLLIVGGGALFSIVIRTGKIEHIFLNRYTLSSYPLNSLNKIKAQSGVYAAVLHFRDGKIRIFSMHLREVHRLLNDLGR